MPNNYDIHNKGQTAKQGHSSCFSTLWSTWAGFDADSSVVYHIQVNRNRPVAIIDKPTVLWYCDKLTKFGLIHEIEKIVEIKDSKQIDASIGVKWRGSKNLMMATLCPLRYMEENPYPRLVDTFHQLCQKYPKLNDFALFQL